MYITPIQLAAGPGMLKELSELFELPPALLQATLGGGDRSAFSAAEIAAADAALDVMDDVCLQTAGEMDAYLVRRGYTLPLDATQFPILTRLARPIARYHLHPQRDLTDEASGRIERDYRNALKQLAAIAAGEMGIGATDPLLAPGGAAVVVGGPEVSAPARVFSHDTLSDF